MKSGCRLAPVIISIRRVLLYGRLLSMKQGARDTTIIIALCHQHVPRARAGITPEGIVRAMEGVMLLLTSRARQRSGSISAFR